MRRGAARQTLAVAVLLAGAYCAVPGSPLDVPLYRQKKNGCGAASVAMVIHYWANRGPGPLTDIPSPKQVYEALYRPERKGIRLADMDRYLKDAGFRVFAIRGRWEDIQEHVTKGRPLIAALRKGPTKAMHFVVVTWATDELLWVNDPTRKKPNRLKRAEFEKQWAYADGWLLLATP